MARPIMVQGTMSSAGKSLICAGLCRIFHQDGYRTAPFKSQNMALNSFITDEGLEMGRAQVMQAEAAGIQPSVRMNPILLKPTGDTDSQVIVNGEVRGSYSAKEYFAMKRSLVPDIMKAYESLAAENDIIVIEGAGSPAEINLKKDDIVNMGMAKMASAPVLLAGDIDRGGVFAQLAGTLMLLDEEEKARVKGLIINKFRGDVSILKSGLDQIEAITGVPVLGVVPWLHLDLDDEDSLSERLTQTGGQGEIDIAVIRLPHISNFTDMNPLQRTEGLSVRYVESARHFGQPDMVILPGTKNTMDDMRWLRESGLETLIVRAASRDVPVMGICGGYQMLGESLSDPEGTESGKPCSMRGAGLLPVMTVFTDEKTRTRITGTITGAEGILGSLNGMKIEGYEIHMGKTENSGHSYAQTEAKSGEILTRGQDGASLGNVCGTYVHGIFDAAGVPEKIARALAEKKGITLAGADAQDRGSYAQGQYDRLADALRAALDMEAVYRILEGGKIR